MYSIYILYVTFICLTLEDTAIKNPRLGTVWVLLMLSLNIVDMSPLRTWHYPRCKPWFYWAPSSFFANRHWPILTASLQNPKRSWWRVAIWEWSWAWTVYLSPRSCWLHVLNKLGFLHLGRAIFKASCALTSHWKTVQIRYDKVRYVR